MRECHSGGNVFDWPVIPAKPVLEGTWGVGIQSVDCALVEACGVDSRWGLPWLRWDGNDRGLGRPYVANDTPIVIRNTLCVRSPCGKIALTSDGAAYRQSQLGGVNVQLCDVQSTESNWRD